MTRRLLIIWPVCILLTTTARHKLLAQEPPSFTIRPPTNSSVNINSVPDNLKQLLGTMVREALPHDYENRKHWGHQKKTWDGVSMRMDGLKLKTKRKWKQANHGTWKRYEVEMIEPESNLAVSLDNFSKLDDGTTTFDIALASRLKCFGQLQRWNRGIKIFSISADARADVEVKLQCAVSTSMDVTQLPPAILFHPKVTHGEVTLHDFKLDRISHADGPVVHELGDAIEDLLQQELADRSGKLVEKMNRQIKKKEGKLRISLHDHVKYDWLQPETK